ncbi:alpha/beta fold hydrolase [Chitinophaga nivalis]|uniref:Alpha/beta fold hydrolase n=1 Tax=Chitinophaga nivalis TaxID=2991709 RepID=A0ABT3IS22_9BACT|nr:alpha/beta hydrolase [Chitinophaga nivalis]MCW3463537.1 alpha/beta fold hydrolase [Chitinophaga nivalis]MCW3486773.1 alpha/beta fold hydrolase [Chitinophaga nivalis]
MKTSKCHHSSRKRLYAITTWLLLLQVIFAGHIKANKPPATFVLVPGSFQPASVWDAVKNELQQRGQRVIIVALPGYGKDTTPPASIHLNTYRDKVMAAIQQTKGKVILVGHSMGGMIISAVAEAMPGRIEKLVYVGAFVPKSNESLLELAAGDKESELHALLVPAADFSTISIRDVHKIPDVFCADCPEAIKQKLIAENQPDPYNPSNERVAVTAAAFGSVDKYYIYTRLDRTLGITLQKQMAAEAGIKKGYTLESSHFPHLSMPTALTDLLMKIGQ